MALDDYSVQQSLLAAMNEPDLECVAIVGRKPDGEVYRFIGGEGMTNERLIFLAHSLVKLADEEG